MRKRASLSVVLAFTASVTSVLAQLTLNPLSTFGTNNDGTIRPGDFDYTWLTADGSRYQRGMAYNPTTGHLIIVNRNPGVESINVIDALTGTNVGTLDLSATSLGGADGFVYDQVAVADDGAIYVGNLTTSGALVEYTLYRWESETSLQTRVYGPPNGDPGNGTAGNLRWGDTLAARGSGLNTEILIASRGTVAAVLRPTDSSMAAFNSTTLTTDVPGGALGYGLCFGPGTTFYGKAASAAGDPLYHLAYDLNAGTATTLHRYGADQFPGRVGVLAVASASNLLAAIEFTTGTNADRVRLYDIADPTAPPVFLVRNEVAVWTNANNIYSGAVAFGGKNVYFLNSDNGLAAFTITNDTAPSVAPVIFYEPVSKIIQLTSNNVFTVGADGTTPLAYQWQFNGTNIANATTSSFSVTNATPQTNQGSYSVVVTNDYGAATSAVAVLTVLASYGNTLIHEPFNYAVGSFLDGQGGWVLNSGARIPVADGSLTVPYLARSTGNHVALSANGTTRFPIGAYSQGALYFSFAMKLDDATATTSETTAAFAIGTSTSYTPKVNIAGDGTGKYTIGVYKGSGTTFGGVATNADGSARLFTTGETVFVVARCVFNSGSTSDDTCDLWVNPDPSTFGALTPPTPSIGPIGAGRADVTGMDRFALRDSSGYPGRHFDEVRVGFDWASVTPPANPQLDISLNGPDVKLLWPTNVSTGYILQSIRAWDDIDGWQPVTKPVVVEGVSNTVTVTATGTKFFRLKK
jgi:hypothetical protein